MQQHTHESEPSGVLKNGCFRMHPSVAAFLTAVFCLVGTSSAAALKVRVGAATRLEGYAARVPSTHGSGLLVVRGALRDDSGDGIANQHVGMTFRAPTAGDAALPVPEPQPCADGEIMDHEPHVAPDEYVVDTSTSGAFCIQAMVPEAVTVELRFAGSGLLDASRADVAVQARPPSSLVFETAPVVSLDRPSWEVRVRLTEPFGDSTWRARLRDERGHDLGDAAFASDGRVRWEVATAQLGNPGAGELIASLEGAGAPATAATQPIERHARVNLVVNGGAPVDYREGAAISVTISSSRGAVAGGFVEARVRERTLATSAVREGRASWTARALSEDTTSSEVELRYWPDAPWWEPGQPRTIPLPLGAHRVSWVQRALAGIALLVAGWMMRGSVALRMPPWLRTRVRWQRAPEATESGREPAPSPSSQRRLIRVVDAHDHSPVREAEAHITVARFPDAPSAPHPGGAGAHADARSDDGQPGSALWSQSAPDGCFQLPAGALPADAVLRIGSPLHVGVTLTMPQAAETVVRLLARRRHLLDRFAEWATREHRHAATRVEPTPQQVAASARGDATRSDVATWAQAVERAAFGAAPVDEHVERRVLALEPKPGAQLHVTIGPQARERPRR